MTPAAAVRRLAFAVTVLGLGLAAASAAEPVQLITPEEASLPAPAAAGGQYRNVTRGPGVDALAPPPIGVKGGPFRLAVKFKPRNGVPVDPARVRLTYRREPAVDVTYRVKPFITAEGIEAPAVIAPPGRHVIDIEAVDMEGRVGRGQITLTIAPPQ